MKQSLLQKTIFICLLGIATAETSSWGVPFTVDASETAVAPTGAASSVALPSPVETSTPGQSFPPGISARPTSFPISNSKSIGSAVDTTTQVVSSAAVSTGNATMTTSTMSSGSAGGTRSTTRSSATRSNTGGAPTSTASVPGAAASLEGHQKMIFAGAVAGIGGLMFL